MDAKGKADVQKLNIERSTSNIEHPSKEGTQGGVRRQQGVRRPVNIGRNACFQGERWV